MISEINTRIPWNPSKNIEQNDWIGLANFILLKKIIWKNPSPKTFQNQFSSLCFILLLSNYENSSIASIRLCSKREYDSIHKYIYIVSLKNQTIQTQNSVIQTKAERHKRQKIIFLWARILMQEKYELPSNQNLPNDTLGNQNLPNDTFFIPMSRESKQTMRRTVCVRRNASKNYKKHKPRKWNLKNRSSMQTLGRPAVALTGKGCWCCVTCFSYYSFFRYVPFLVVRE